MPELFIDGTWRDAADGGTREIRCPADGSLVATVSEGTAEDAMAAVRAARKAFDDGPWRDTTALERSEILHRVADLLEEQKDELTELMSREMGKVLAEAGGDVQEAIDMSVYMAGEGRRLFGHTTPSELRDKFQMSVRMPIGVIGVITPWNFPIAIPSWKIAPALVAGNTVVFKPATDTPALLTHHFADASTLPAGQGFMFYAPRPASPFAAHDVYRVEPGPSTFARLSYQGERIPELPELGHRCGVAVDRHDDRDAAHVQQPRTGRLELAERERDEMRIIERFLPQQTPRPQLEDATMAGGMPCPGFTSVSNVQSSPWWLSSTPGASNGMPWRPRKPRVAWRQALPVVHQPRRFHHGRD